MTTYLLRHGQTPYSKSHRVNGEPRLGLLLDATGRSQCRLARQSVPVEEIRSCVTSRFPRAIETARLMLEGSQVSVTTDGQLDELDYGTFEGGPFTRYAAWLAVHSPHARPPGATESQREGIRRMLDGLRSALALPGPRLVVTHGLALSVFTWRQQHPLTAADVFLPEAPCAAPIAIGDVEMHNIISCLIADLEDEADHNGGAGRCSDRPQAGELLSSAAGNATGDDGTDA